MNAVVRYGTCLKAKDNHFQHRLKYDKENSILTAIYIKLQHADPDS